MDGRSFAGKTTVFLVICVFFALFILFFGTAHALLGVTIATAAMFMLSKDLSVRPLHNAGSLMAFMVAMGLGSYIASLDPYLGLAVNFSVVFMVVFLSMQDLRSPMHFPMLLFYISMTAVPVSLGEMPDRLLILAVSALFIVGLNVMVNRGSQTGSSHRAVAALCGEVRRCAIDVLDGGNPDTGGLERLGAEVNRNMYDRLKNRFFTTPKDRRVLDLAVSLTDLGREVCERERGPEALAGIVWIMDLVESHENGGMGADEVARAVDSFLSGGADIGHGASLALRDLASELVELESGPEGETGCGRRPGLRPLAWTLGEEARSDSVRFTFSVRMALMFSLVAFAWTYWGWDGGQTLLFTVVAMIVPYLEDSWKQSAARVSGTVLGTIGFLAAAMLCGGDPVAMIAVGLLAGYAYVVFDGGGYERRMFFYTILVLVASSFVNPSATLALDRVVYTFAGMFVALVANRVILPYRVSNENMELAIRHMGIARERILNIRDIVNGREDGEEEAGLAIISANISRKMGMTAERSSDAAAEQFLIRQDSLSMQCSSLYRAVKRTGPECRRILASVLEPDPDSDGVREPADVSGLDPYDAECVRRAERILSAYRDNRRLMYDVIVAGTLGSGHMRRRRGIEVDR